MACGNVNHTNEKGPQTMEDYSDTTYGEPVAEIFDELYTDYDPESIDLLAELSLMAQLPGLSLVDRRGSCKKEIFTRESRKHITIYGIAK